MEAVPLADRLGEDFGEKEDGGNGDENGGDGVEQAVEEYWESFERRGIDEQEGDEKPVRVADELRNKGGEVCGESGRVVACVEMAGVGHVQLSRRLTGSTCDTSQTSRGVPVLLKTSRSTLHAFRRKGRSTLHRTRSRPASTKSAPVQG